MVPRFTANAMPHPRMKRQLLKPKDAYHASVWRQLFCTLYFFVKISSGNILSASVLNLTVGIIHPFADL